MKDSLLSFDPFVFFSFVSIFFFFFFKSRCLFYGKCDILTKGKKKKKMKIRVFEGSSTGRQILETIFVTL